VPDNTSIKALLKPALIDTLTDKTNDREVAHERRVDYSYYYAQNSDITDGSEV
jgi:hypothetical protein